MINIIHIDTIKPFDKILNNIRRIKSTIRFRESLVNQLEEKASIKVVSDVEPQKYFILKVKLNYLQFLNIKPPKIVLTTQSKKVTKKYSHLAQ